MQYTREKASLDRKFECQNCGTCCSEMTTIYPSREEVQKLAEYLNISENVGINTKRQINQLPQSFADVIEDSPTFSLTMSEENLMALWCKVWECGVAQL